MNKEILKRTNKPINNKSNFPTFKSNKKNQHFNTKTPVLRKKKELTPYTFIK